MNGAWHILWVTAIFASGGDAGHPWTAPASAGLHAGDTQTALAAAVRLAAGNSSVRGYVALTSNDGDGSVQITGTVDGLPPGGRFGFHVHEFGDLSDGCASAGDHWNPFGRTHGDVADTSRPRHSGDLSNIESDAGGVARFSIRSAELRLRGQRSIVGRMLVVHERRDDLGLGSQPTSHTTGDSGGRLACGVIGLTGGSDVCS